MQNDDFEARLKLLSPAAGRVDAVTAAYIAGKRNSQRAINRWRGVAGLITVAAIAPWMVPKSRPVVVAPAEIAIFQTAPTPEQVEPIPPGNIWQLRAAVLEKGLDGLPKTELPPAEPTHAFDIY
jgi:hypothetical protein